MIMSMHSEIDQALDRLGGVEPPAGMSERIQRRLQEQPRVSAPRPFASRMRIVSVSALAASVALSAVVLNPSVRHRILHPYASPAAPLQPMRVVIPGSGFGAAGAVHVPIEPVPVQPTPVGQGRGRARSGRAVLPSGNLAPLPRGVTARANPSGATAPPR
jgi:hypothetical protein